MDMNNYNLEEIIEECPDCGELILWLEVSQNTTALQTIYDYKIYDELLVNLNKLCHEDYELVVTSLEIIRDRKYITRNIVHDNLCMKNPVPFARKIAPHKNNTLRKTFYYFEGYNFYQEYMKVKNQSNKKSR